MRIKLDGGPEDLIERCGGCDYCIFEDILTPEQRKIKVLDKPIPINHAHRAIIEQICGQNYDEPCPMKYAAMRSLYDDFMATQLGAVKIFITDLWKRDHYKFKYDEALPRWTEVKDLGRGKEESYAERFRDIWNLGLRGDKQMKTAKGIYEMVVSDQYGLHVQSSTVLQDEALERKKLHKYVK